MNRFLVAFSPDRLRPSLPDWVFVALLTLILTGGRHQLLNDPGTPWHLQLGRGILRTGILPTQDTFTFTRQGSSWIDQSWACDVALASLVDRFGWSSALLASSVLIAWIYGSLAKGLLDDGRKPLSALVAVLLAVMVGSIHFLVRPHLFTFAGVLITSRLCSRQHERGGWPIFWVPVVVAFWANLHGGFLAAPLIVLTAAFGHAISRPLDRDRRVNLAKFVAAAFLTLIAPILNPYGLNLYRHVFELLVTSGLTPLIQEYQSMPFGKPESRAMEWIILLLVALPIFKAGRMSRYECVQTLIWLHLSLATIRHAPIFGIIAAPGLARMFDGLFSDDAKPSTERSSIWPGVSVASLALLVFGGWSFGGFDPKVWPIAALPSLNELPKAAPLFHEQDWGGLIECETNPRRLAFIDDRFELFGKEFLLEYISAIEGGPEWEKIRDRYKIGIVWVRPERGLARRLESDRAWSQVYRDAISVVFEREKPSGEPNRLTRTAPFRSRE